MIEEHIKKDNKSHAFKHLHSNTACFDPHNCFSLKIIDKANSKVNSKVKTVLRTNWKKPNLTWQLPPSSSKKSNFSLKCNLMNYICICVIFQNK